VSFIDLYLRKVWASSPDFFKPMKLLIGRKLNMTQNYGEKGEVIPVTIVKVAQGTVTQIKEKEKDGYVSVQLAFNEGSKNVNKSIVGHVKGLVERPKLKEMRVEDASNFEVGQKYDLSSFEEGEIVSVAGTSKGKGYAGVVKRYGFRGNKATHGNKHSLRSPGSIGATDAARVFPGMRMAGHMGAERVTISNLEIIKIDSKEGLITIKGAVPGARNGIVEISSDGEMSPCVKSSEDKKVVNEEKKEEKKEESKE